MIRTLNKLSLSLYIEIKNRQFMRTLRLSIAIQSHLSDAAFEMSFNPEMAENRIHFVKTLINLYPNTDVEVEEAELTRIYKERILGIVEK